MIESLRFLCKCPGEMTGLLTILIIINVRYLVQVPRKKILKKKSTWLLTSEFEIYSRFRTPWSLPLFFNNEGLILDVSYRHTKSLHFSFIFILKTNFFHSEKFYTILKQFSYKGGIIFWFFWVTDPPKFSFKGKKKSEKRKKNKEHWRNTRPEILHACFDSDWHW